MSESELLLPLSFMFFTPFPLPVTMGVLRLYGTNVGLPGIIFSNLISESGTLVWGFC